MERAITLSTQARPPREARLIDEILPGYREQLGPDFDAYRNHVLRVLGLCSLLAPLSDVDHRQLQIAACFHDLGIWTQRTFDYLAPSRALAEDYLTRSGRSEWTPQVLRIVDSHHKLTRSADRLTEYFRRADWIDVSYGFFRFGVPRAQIRALQTHHPDAGFHARLAQLGFRQLLRRPWNPLPMLRW